MSKKLIESSASEAKQLHDYFVDYARTSLDEVTSEKIKQMVTQKLRESADAELEEAFQSNESEITEEFDFSTFLQEEEDEIEAADPETETEPSGDEFGAEGEDDALADPTAGGDEFGAEGESDGSTLVGDLTKDELLSLIQDAIAGSSDDFSGDIEAGAEIEDSSLSGIDSPESTEFGPEGGAEAGDEFGGTEDEIDELLREISDDMAGDSDLRQENADLRQELKTTQSALQEVTSKMASMNLLNAKLSYTAKLLKSGTLNESASARAIENMDKAKSVKEAKLIYETIVKTVGKQTKIKANLKESLGFNSKPTGTAPKSSQELISEGIFNRFRVLSGIQDPEF